MSSTRKPSAARSKPSTPIHIRARKPQKDLIDTAAALLGKTRSDFMLESACREAETVILDRRVIQMGSREYAEFLTRLDAPPVATPGLKKLAAVRAPWDR